MMSMMNILFTGEVGQDEQNSVLGYLGEIDPIGQGLLKVSFITFYKICLDYQKATKD
jgi:hypothetical protein